MDYAILLMILWYYRSMVVGKEEYAKEVAATFLSTSLDFTLWHQRPTATSAFSWASVCLANISSERSRCALAEPDCRSDHSGFGKPCHVERSPNFQAKFELKKHHLLLLQYHPLSIKPNLCRAFSRLGMWNDGEWWQLLGSAGKSLEPLPPRKAVKLGRPWWSPELNLSNEIGIVHDVAQDQWKHTLFSDSLGTATGFGENCGEALKITAKFACFVELESYSPSQQQIPNSKFPCSIPG